LCFNISIISLSAIFHVYASDICGLYVVFFALMRICFQIPIDNIYMYDMFFSKNVNVNDEFVKSYFK
jgi:hypothetical protein